MLIEYLKNVNPSVQTGVLLQSDAGPSKKSRRSKKDTKATPEKAVQETKPKKSPPKQSKIEEQVSKVLTKPVEPVGDEQDKESIPSKSGVFKRIKKKAHGSRMSPPLVRKQHITRQGVIVREIQAPVSPSSKKRWLKIWRRIFPRRLKRESW